MQTLPYEEFLRVLFGCEIFAVYPEFRPVAEKNRPEYCLKDDAGMSSMHFVQLALDLEALMREQPQFEHVAVPFQCISDTTLRGLYLLACDLTKRQAEVV